MARKYRSRDSNGRFVQEKGRRTSSSLQRIWKRPMSDRESYVLWAGIPLSFLLVFIGQIQWAFLVGLATVVAFTIISNKEEVKANMNGIFPIYKVSPSVIGTRLTHFRTWVAGLEHHSLSEVSSLIEVGTVLDLKREPDNQYDSNAISVWLNGYKIGFLKREIANSFYKQFDKGDEFRADVVGYFPESSDYDRLFIDLIDVSYQKQIKKSLMY